MIRLIDVKFRGTVKSDINCRTALTSSELPAIKTELELDVFDLWLRFPETCNILCFKACLYNFLEGSGKCFSKSLLNSFCYSYFDRCQNCFMLADY